MRVKSKNINDCVGICDYVSLNQRDCFKTKSGELLKPYRLLGRRGLQQMSLEDLTRFIQRVSKDLRSLPCPIQFVSLSEPKSYQTQIDYYEYRLNHSPLVKNDRQRAELKDEIEKLKWLEQYQTVERYYLFLIVKDIDELQDTIQWLERLTTFEVEALSEEEAIQLFRKLNNLDV